MILHAGLLARRHGGRWRSVLLRGASGEGKSDLALRALAAGWRLVADDRVTLWRSGGRLYGASPQPLRGLIEARGLGVVGEPALPFAALALVVDACATPERMPDAAEVRLLGMTLPLRTLALREASSLAKLERALAGALGGHL